MSIDQLTKEKTEIQADLGACVVLANEKDLYAIELEQDLMKKRMKIIELEQELENTQAYVEELKKSLWRYKKYTLLGVCVRVKNQVKRIVKRMCNRM